MKTKCTFLLMILAMLMACTLTGCGDKENDPGATDPGAAVSGVYTGQLKKGSTIVSDAYVVKVTKVSSSVATVQADFYGEMGSSNYNITSSGSMYVLSSATDSNITIAVSGKSITINYTNTAGTLLTFTGSKD